MDFKKLGKRLFFPHVAFLIVLLPVATVFLVYSMVFMGTKAPVSIVSYVLAAYTLAIWCLRIPSIVRLAKSFKEENHYAQRWLTDTHLRVTVSLYGSLIWNTAYGVFMLGLGFYHSTFWFYSMAGYYILLGVMRFFLASYTKKKIPGRNIEEELKKYRNCGIVLLMMNLMVSIMVFFMVYWGRTFKHHEITTIAMATYTFTAFTIAIINVVKYKKYNSPVYSASKNVSLASACVSMITLETTMLTSFDDGTMPLWAQKLLLGLSGGAVSVFIIVMAIWMIVKSNRKIKALVEEKTNG